MTDNATILVVDDHEDLLENIGLALEASGFEVLMANDGFKALEILEDRGIDLILADIAMPRMNGYQLYERVRADERWLSIPFVLLSARAMDSDIRYGKELGVDDYLTKPIQPEDLLAAVRGKLRRAHQLSQVRRVDNGVSGEEMVEITVGNLRIDPGQHQAWFQDRRLKLSAREFTLLTVLAENPGHVFSAEELIRETHDLETDHIEAGSLLRPLIRSLRRKLGYDVGELGCIENIRGIGYRLVPSGG